ncbi:tRNA N(3)-cytidine methyltransferase METTL6 [Megalopta genalis]|uniref:tRNA N(3)-cytidine methyltransferase METTL6 n=1 Tax=Megalopta genalis TaxID=115081 RepID=UPI003FD3B2E0
MAESTDPNGEYVDHVAKHLTEEETEKMRKQNSRLVTEFRADQFEKYAKKHWDLFYKRNETRFFKDRHWTTREFSELLGLGSLEDPKVILEIGCGVGNFVYPLIEDGLNFKQIFACDLSPRAVEFMKAHALYDPDKMKIFEADVTTEDCFADVNLPVNAATLIFVLSAIHPEKFRRVIENVYRVLDDKGVVLLRDYGRYDMAQLRFKPGQKISENFYVRHDGTRSYYFTIEEVVDLFESIGFKTLTCDYVKRRTVNVKENIDVERIFVQGKFEKSR